MEQESNNSLVSVPEIDSDSIKENEVSARTESMSDNVSSSAHSFDTITLRGMPIHSVTRKQTVKHLIDCSLSGVGGWIVTPNLDIVRRYRNSVTFRNLIATSTLNVADGMPLVWISRVKGQSLPERVNGTDLMFDVCDAAAKAGRSVFFLGGNPGSAEHTAAAMLKDYPELIVAGCHCPEFGFEKDIENVAEIAEILSKANPDIVFVGLGSPKQDVLINMLQLKLPSMWWLGVGVSFSFISGELVRAPDWAKTSGFEWGYRLIAEPKRLAKRYLLQGIPFLAVTLVVSVYERLTGKK